MDPSVPDLRNRSRAVLGLFLLIGCGLREIDHRPAGHTMVGPDAAVEPEPQPEPSPTPTPMPMPMPMPMPGVDAAVRMDAGQAGPADAAPAAMGGPGVMIAGQFVPRAKAIVFLHIGHSNMAGRATGPADLKPYFYDTDPHLVTYAKGGAFRPAREPTAPDNEMGQAAGPGMAILRAAQAVAPPDAYFISIGHGHSGSFGGNCAAFRKGGLLYDLVMGPAREVKGRVTFAAIMTMFGQSEHNVPPAQQKMFLSCLQGVAADMRGDLGEPALPYIVGGYEMGISRSDIAPNSAFAVPIIAQLQMVPGQVTTSALIATDGFPMEDDHHFNMAGHKMWAAAGIKLLVDHEWAPWAGH
jgi:hypothetical protein